MKKEIIWTIEKSQKEALKYNTKVEFKKNSNRAYIVLCKAKLLNESCQHMYHPKPKLKWTKEKCIEVAKQCKSKSEFNTRFCGAYKSSKKNGWFNELLQYFQPIGSKYKRCIYSALFADNSVYIGLTYNLKKRIKQHLNNRDSAVFKHIEKTNIIPEFIQLTDYIDYKEASQKEGDVLEEFIYKGYNILNRTGTGGLGGNDTIIKKWTKEKCIEVAKQCNTYKEFRKNYSGAYNYCIKNNFLETIIDIIPRKNNKRKNWNKEDVLVECNKYKTIKEFVLNCPSAYSYMLRHHLLDELRKNKYILQRDSWTFEEAQIEALKYQTKKEFKTNSSGCYGVCYKRGWLNLVCSHMRDLKKERIIYTEEKVIEHLKNFEYLEQLKKSDNKYTRGCYWWLKSNKKLIEFKKYLKSPNYIPFRWTDEKAFQELKKYKTYSDFRKNNNSCYQYFQRKNKLIEIKKYYSNYEKIKL